MRLSLCRNSLWILAFAAGTLAFAARPALAAGPTTSAFSATGSGTSAGYTDGCTQCASSDTCYCTKVLNGIGTASVIGKVTIATTFVLDATNAPAGVCDDSYGTLTLTQKTNSRNILIIDYHGFLCIGPSYTTLNGTYYIDGASSAGKFAGYSGSGNMGGSENLDTGDILGNLNGTIQTP